LAGYRRHQINRSGQLPNYNEPKQKSTKKISWCFLFP
jgi:hypothetical protein